MEFDKSYVDKAFINGRVITANSEDEIVEAVGLKNNKIVYVGTTKELLELTDASTQVVDLDGKTMMPGLIDSHFHPILNGFFGDTLDSAIIATGKMTSVTEILEMLEAAVATRQPGEWISTMGYSPSFLEEKRDPTLEELDHVAPCNPVQLMDASGHISMYNSLALQSIGVYCPEDAKKYPPNEVEVINGKLTGMVKDHTHFKIWGNVGYTKKQQIDAAMKSHELLLQNGITSVHDCGECGAPSYKIMRKLCDEGTFKVREYMMLHNIFGKPFALEENEHWLALGMMTGLGDEHFKMGTCKFMIDGGSGAPSSLCKEPYSHDPKLPGICGWEKQEVSDYITRINEAECQITAHAMGDLAIEYMVAGYEDAFALSPRNDLRHRIEHCMVVDEDLIARMAKMNICPTINTGMLTFNGRNYDRIYGKKRAKHIMALRGMLDAGMRPSIASDAPSGPLGFTVIDGAVNRYDRKTGFQYDKTQAITVLEAVRCATINGAYSSFEDDIKGSIEVGKLADLVVLNEDILSIDTFDLDKVEVMATYIDGQLVYAA